MNNHKSTGVTAAALTVGLAVSVFCAGCQASADNTQMPREQQARFTALQAQGARAAVTLFPVVMADSAFTDVANVLGLMLEQAGMKNLEATEVVFRLPEAAGFDQAGELFGEFVRDHPIDTEYALYAEFVGDPATGPQEIRCLIVDRTGQSVWIDRQTPADRAFKRAKPNCPMTCCQFVAERIRVHLDIPKSARDDSGTGTFARKMKQDSPAPDEAEWTAMKRRQQAMHKAGRNASVAVFPVRLSDDEVGLTDAAHLASLLSAKELCAAGAVDSSLRVKIEPARNEQKLLWQLVRTVKDHVKQNPPDADYVLVADYMMAPTPDRVWAVHFVVCDRDGEWVIVDFQNEHHDDFQGIDPKTRDDCGSLVTKRLASYLR